MLMSEQAFASVPSMDTVDFEELCGFDPAGKTRRQLEAALERCGRVTSFVASKKLAALAALSNLADEGPAPADANRAKTRESSQASKRAAATANQLTSMPALQQALAEGEISPEHADAAAAAAERVSPEAADEALARLATQLPADRFAKKAREWAGENEDQDEAESRQQRARRERDGRIWRKKDGRIAIFGELDPIAGNPVLDAWQEEMDRLFRLDGGREADPATARTYAQRGADALAHLLTRTPAPAPSPTSTAKRPHPRFVTHLRIDASRCTADNPTGAAAFIDGTPLPQATLERIACESAFVGAVYGADGSLLWQGRNVRLATDDQWHALIDRDGGCRHCGADPSRCQAHHLTPWAPPARGPTDIDNLVLACDHGHHLIHDHGWRVEIDADGLFQIVPP
jgi:5-methylcytosine-specific restriction protein A